MGACVPANRQDISQKIAVSDLKIHPEEKDLRQTNYTRQSSQQYQQSFKKEKEILSNTQRIKIIEKLDNIPKQVTLNIVGNKNFENQKKNNVRISNYDHKNTSNSVEYLENSSFFVEVEQSQTEK